jgi:hypothetical protein
MMTKAMTLLIKASRAQLPKVKRWQVMDWMAFMVCSKVKGVVNIPLIRRRLRRTMSTLRRVPLAPSRTARDMAARFVI